MTRCQDAKRCGCQDAGMPASELTSAGERERGTWACLRLAAIAAALSLVLLPEARGAVFDVVADLPTLLRLGLVLFGPWGAAALLVPALMLADRFPALACCVLSSAGVTLALCVGCWVVPCEGFLEMVAHLLGTFFTVRVVVELGGYLLELMGHGAE